MTKYLEDFQVGDTDEYGSYTMTEEEIVGFAEQYDPQDVHTDPEAAEETRYDGLIASGWQTVNIAMRLAVEYGYLEDLAVVAGIAVESIEWNQPVRPGDTLRVEEEIVGRNPSESDPEQGVLEIEITVFNQNDVPVLSSVWVDIVHRAPSAG